MEKANMYEIVKNIIENLTEKESTYKFGGLITLKSLQAETKKYGGMRSCFKKRKCEKGYFSPRGMEVIHNEGLNNKRKKILIPKS